MANRKRSGDAGGWPYRFDERDGSVDRYAGGTRGNARDDYRGSGPYGGSFTAGGRAGAGYGGGYHGYSQGSADPDNDSGRDEERGAYGEGGPDSGRRRMMGGGYGGAQTRGGAGMADTDYGMISGADFGRAWGGPDAGRGDDTARGSYAGTGPRGYRRSDVRINEDVCDALTDDRELDASDIEVRVESGEVTLAGTVTDRYSKRRAEDVAATVRGVWDVQNRLGIRRAGSPARESDTGVDREIAPELADESPTSTARRKRR